MTVFQPDLWSRLARGRENKTNVGRKDYICRVQAKSPRDKPQACKTKLFGQICLFLKNGEQNKMKRISFAKT